MVLDSSRLISTKWDIYIFILFPVIRIPFRRWEEKLEKPETMNNNRETVFSGHSTANTHLNSHGVQHHAQTLHRIKPDILSARKAEVVMQSNPKLRSFWKLIVSVESYILKNIWATLFELSGLKKGGITMLHWLGRREIWEDLGG